MGAAVISSCLAVETKQVVLTQAGCADRCLDFEASTGVSLSENCRRSKWSGVL
jgi:hypothetical protein